MADQLLLPLQLFDNNGSPVVASDNIEFYDTGTTTPRSVFSEAALSTNLGTTMDTNAGGRLEFNPVFVASGSAVKVVFKDSAGAILETLDPCPATAVVASAAADISFDAVTNNAATDVQAAIENVTALYSATDTTRYATSNKTNSGGRSVYDLMRGASSAVVPVVGERYRLTVNTSPTTDYPVSIRLTNSSDTGSYYPVKVLSGGGNKTELGPIGSNGAWFRSADQLDLVFDGTDFVIERAQNVGTGGHRIVQLDASGYLPAVSGRNLTDAWVFIERQTASGSATIDIDLSDSYSVFRIDLANVIPATDGALLHCLFSNDAGATFESSAYYDWSGTQEGSSLQTGTGANEIVLTANSTVGNDAELGLSGTIMVYAPTAAGSRTAVRSNVTATKTTGAPIGVTCSGFVTTAEDNDAIRLLFDAGNIASGTITVSAIS